LVGNEAGRFHPGERAGRQLLQLAEQGIIHLLEVEARLALHAAAQLGRASLQQTPVAVDAHQVVRDVSLSDLHPCDGDRVAPHLATPRAQRRRPDWPVQAVMIGGVALNPKCARVLLKNLAEAVEHWLEWLRHACSRLTAMIWR